MYRFVLLSFSKKKRKNGLCVGFLPPAVRGIFCVFVYVHFLCEISLLKKIPCGHLTVPHGKFSSRLYRKELWSDDGVSPPFYSSF